MIGLQRTMPLPAGVVDDGGDEVVVVLPRPVAAANSQPSGGDERAGVAAVESAAPRVASTTAASPPIWSGSAQAIHSVLAAGPPSFCSGSCWSGVISPSAEMSTR